MALRGVRAEHYRLRARLEELGDPEASFAELLDHFGRGVEAVPVDEDFDQCSSGSSRSILERTYPPGAKACSGSSPRRGVTSRRTKRSSSRRTATCRAIAADAPADIGLADEAFDRAYSLLRYNRLGRRTHDRGVEFGPQQIGKLGGRDVHQTVILEPEEIV